MEQNKYDLAVAYRIYPKVSKIPFIYPNDKLKLAEVGVRTFKNSLGKLNAKVFFLLDNCPVEYEQMIRTYFTEENADIVRYHGIGNILTFGEQINILLKQKYSDIVFFAEDDYVYRDKLLESAVSLFRHNKSVHFVTPYDHLDSYILPIHTHNKYNIIINEGLHWRTAASTCLTFLTTKEILSETKQTFESYCQGNWDSSLWFSLTKYNVFDFRMALSFLFKDRFLFKVITLSWIKGWKQILIGRKYKLWQPIPSIGTHMEHVSLAPNVDWRDIADE